MDSHEKSWKDDVIKEQQVLQRKLHTTYKITHPEISLKKAKNN